MPQADVDADVLPPIANQSMALLWLLLFGGRSLIVPFLQAAGLLQPQQVAEWDDGLLLRLYLILFSITVVVFALRLARRSRPSSLPKQVRDPDQSSHADTPGRESSSVPQTRKEKKGP